MIDPILNYQNSHSLTQGHLNTISKLMIHGDMQLAEEEAARLLKFIKTTRVMIANGDCKAPFSPWRDLAQAMTALAVLGLLTLAVGLWLYVRGARW